MAFARGFSSELQDKGIDFEGRVLNYYLGVVRVPSLIVSPFRIDHNPSLALSVTNHRHIWWKDFGTQESGNLWELLAKTWGTTIRDVEARVLKDLPDILSISFSPSLSPTSNYSKSKIVHSTDTLLEVKVREWRPYDLEYWDSYGISKEWLQFGDIYPISHIIITKNDQTSIIPAEKYAYVFVEFKDNIASLKVYQPFSKQYKWTNKHDRSVWDLWTKLPSTGDTLIITSSRKDALCVWSNTGIPCVSLQGEGYIPKPHVVQELIHRFKKIFILYDNDFRSEKNYGHEYGKQLAETYGFIQIEIPTSYHAKDPSDLCHEYGRQVLQTVIFNLLNNLDNCPF